MKFKMTPEETKQMLAQFENPHFTNVTNYITLVTTDREWAKEILPPPLEAVDNPLVMIALSGSDQYHGLAVSLQCRCGDVEGYYGLGFIMDTDLAVIYGREGLGEPKKLGVTTTELKDGKFVGTVSRFGQELVRIEATVTGPGDPSLDTGIDYFHYKYAIKADGSGLHGVDLVYVHFDDKVLEMTAMKADKVQLNKSAMDIYGEIPVGQPVACFESKLNMSGHAKYLAHVDPDEFLPYAFFKHDDYRLIG